MEKFKTVIPYGRQDISTADIEAVVDILKGDLITQGPMVPIFENLLADYSGAKHVVVINSATSALHIACLALGVGSEDIVWTSAITFVASANCGLYCGAKIDFVDINPRTYNLSVDCLSEKLAIAEKNGTLPKVLIAVHLAGQPCEMELIYSLSKKYGFKIIEDASHAIGAQYQGTPIGNPCFSDIVIYSFHPVKIITTGEGGAALTNDLQLANRMRLYRGHGITYDSSTMSLMPQEEIWNYQQIDLGFNYRMTDVQAALGISQLNRLGKFVAARHKIAQIYDEELASVPVITPWQRPEIKSSYHLYPIRVNDEASNSMQKKLYNFLRENNVMVNLHYIPVYRHPYYRDKGFPSGYCPEAERYFKSALSLPIYSSMSNVQQEEVLSLLKKGLTL